MAEQTAHEFYAAWPKERLIEELIAMSSGFAVNALKMLEIEDRLRGPVMATHLARMSGEAPQIDYAAIGRDLVARFSVLPEVSNG